MANITKGESKYIRDFAFVTGGIQYTCNAKAVIVTKAKSYLITRTDIGCIFDSLDTFVSLDDVNKSNVFLCDIVSINEMEFEKKWKMNKNLMFSVVCLDSMSMFPFMREEPFKIEEIAKPSTEEESSINYFLGNAIYVCFLSSVLLAEVSIGRERVMKMRIGLKNEMMNVEEVRKILLETFEEIRIRIDYKTVK